ncbi:MAG TPA: hypothetical protein VF276_16210 [Chloroflexia bacterium]
MSTTPPDDDYIPGYATRKEASPAPGSAGFDDTPETRTPWNARSGALIMVGIVLACLAITLAVILFGGLGAVVWR